MSYKNFASKAAAVLLLSSMASLCACGNAKTDSSDASKNQTTQTKVAETTAAETTAAAETTTAAETTAAEVKAPESRAWVHGDYVTYPYKSATFLISTPDERAYGTTMECTSMQGMEASERYLYVAKHKDNQYANVYQYDPVSGEQKLMHYFDSPEATEETALDCVRHINDMAFYTDGDEQSYMLTASTYHPLSNKYASPSLTQLLVNEEDATLTLTGFFNLKRINDAGQSAYLSASSIREVARTDEFGYFLIKNADDFYWCKIPSGTIGGTMTQPVEIECVHLFHIVNRTAHIVNGKGELYAPANLESWTNQGFFYSAEEDLLYVPLFNQYNGAAAGAESVILTFDMDGMLTAEALESVTENRTHAVYPTTLSFYMTILSQSNFEVESCVFLRNQGTDGDLTLYFNTNASDVTKYEGIWAAEYTRGSQKVLPTVTGDSIVYTVEYDYNVDGVSESNWKQETVNNNYSMLRDTVHIDGITTNLRMNRFKKDGSAFLGWQLQRESDEKWLYADDNWYLESEAPAGVEKKTLQDAAPVDHLTTVNGDVICAFAQWS